MNDEKDVVMEQLLDYIEKKMKEVQVNSFIDGFYSCLCTVKKMFNEGKTKKEIMNWCVLMKENKNLLVEKIKNVE